MIEMICGGVRTQLSERQGELTLRVFGDVDSGRLRKTNTLTRQWVNLVVPQGTKKLTLVCCGAPMHVAITHSHVQFVCE